MATKLESLNFQKAHVNKANSFTLYQPVTFKLYRASFMISISHLKSYLRFFYFDSDLELWERTVICTRFKSRLIHLFRNIRVMVLIAFLVKFFSISKSGSLNRVCATEIRSRTVLPRVGLG